MDGETEKRLAGLIESIIKRYNCMDEHLTCLEDDVKAIKRDMKDAAILLRDKHTWRLEEVDREVKAFVAKLDDERTSG